MQNDIDITRKYFRFRNSKQPFEKNGRDGFDGRESGVGVGGGCIRIQIDYLIS